MFAMRGFLPLRSTLIAFSLCSPVLAHAAQPSPTETVFLSTCKDLRAGNVGALIDLPLDKFPDGFMSLRLQTEDAIECVPAYLTFISTLSPGVRAWQLGRALIWNLAEQGHFQYALPDAYPQLALSALNQYLAAHADSPFRYVIQAAVRVLLGRDGDLSDTELATAGGLLETTMPVASGIVTVDPRVPLADIAMTPALADKYKDWFARSALLDLESDSVQEMLGYALAAVFDRDVPPALLTSLQRDIANERLFHFNPNNMVTTGYVAQAFGALLKYQSVAYQSPRLASRIMTLLSARKKMMNPAYVARPSPPWSALPMSISYQSNLYVGRCGEKSGPTAQNATNVTQHHDGGRCDYNGTPGYALFDVETIDSQFIPGDLKGNTASATYTIEVGAKMRGGHRDGGLLGGHENETARVEYSVSGGFRIPQCGDFRTCNPQVWISLQDLTSDPDHGAVRKTVVQYQAPPDNAWNTLTSSTVALSRSAGPINLQIAMSRAAKHVGANCEPYCEPDGALHAIVISANSPIVHGVIDESPGLILHNMYWDMLRGTPPPGLPTGPKPLLAQRLVQIAQDERHFSRKVFRHLFAHAGDLHLPSDRGDAAVGGRADRLARRSRSVDARGTQRLPRTGAHRLPFDAKGNAGSRPTEFHRQHQQGDRGFDRCSEQKPRR